MNHSEWKVLKYILIKHIESSNFFEFHIILSQKKDVRRFELLCYALLANAPLYH